MLFAIDIDGTIAYDQQGEAFARYLNQTLSLGVPDTTLHKLNSYRELALQQNLCEIDKGRSNRAMDVLDIYDILAKYCSVFCC
jgi:hypothetical protein